MQYKLHNEVFDHSNRLKEKEFSIICISPKFNFSIFCHQIVIYLFLSNILFVLHKFIINTSVTPFFLQIK